MNNLVKQKSRLEGDVKYCKHTDYLLPGDWFLCENHLYLTKALSIGPAGVLLTKEIYDEYSNRINCSYVIIEDPKSKWSELANQVFPKKPAWIAGVTGTNGKTSTAYLAHRWLNLLGARAGYIGTLGVIPDVGISIDLTTPDAAELHQILYKFYEEGITHAVLEISSIGLLDKRVNSIALNCAAFTSFSQDHLDIHKTMENYWRSKLEITKLINHKGDFFIHTSLEDNIKKEDIQYRLFPTNKYTNPRFIEFMNDNLQAAGAICESAGFSETELRKTAHLLESVPGRMQIVSENPKVIIDYAHTPDALLKLLKQFNKEELILIFGCGGDRDRSKRKVMGEIANQYAKVVIVTDDNPRTEIPGAIREEIMLGCPDAVEIPSRYDAIKLGIESAKAGGLTCIIAGKGHENTQTYGKISYHFSDLEVSRAFIF